MRPIVSIVMPNFNYGHFLPDALVSVLGQTMQSWELIVIDNQSTDNSLEILDSFSDDRIRVISFQNHGSIAASRNEGLRAATGKYVAFLDSDDKWHRKKLETQLKFHRKPNTVSYHDLALFGSHRFGKVRGWRLQNPLEDMLSGGNPLATSSVMCDRNNFAQGGFPEDLDLVAAEDFALWLDWASRGLNFTYVPKTLGSYRTHEGSNAKGKSTDAARKATKNHSSALSKDKLDQLEGWLAYSEALESRSEGRKLDLLRVSARNSVFRFRWRAIVRIIIARVHLLMSTDRLSR